MTIFAIADLHLSSGDKPMDVFGEQWEHHFEKISLDWRARVSECDVVLLPGDLSWAMQLSEARGHLMEIGALPGRKILIRGNHDYWWSSIARVREALAEGMFALQNDAMEMNDTLFSGTRGWLLPGPEAKREDVKIYERELIRLRLTLEAARKISSEKRLVCMMHFPPLTQTQRDTGFTRLFREFGVRDVVYGHLHGASLKNAFSGEEDGVFYHQASADGLGFRLLSL